MSVDLTVFNGVENPGKTDTSLPAGAAGSVASYERGNPPAPDPTQIASRPFIFWRGVPQPLVGHSAPAAGLIQTTGSAHNVNYALQHTLGFVNNIFGSTSAGTAYTSTSPPLQAYIGAPNGHHDRAVALVPMEQSAIRQSDRIAACSPQPFVLFAATVQCLGGQLFDHASRTAHARPGTFARFLSDYDALHSENGAPFLPLARLRSGAFAVRGHVDRVKPVNIRRRCLAGAGGAKHDFVLPRAVQPGLELSRPGASEHQHDSQRWPRLSRL